MRIKPCLIASVLAGAAAARPAVAAQPWGYGGSAEDLLQQARAARFEKDYAQSLRLSMEVIVSSPSHQEARRLLTETAAEFFRLKAARIEQEGQSILRQAQARQKQLLARRKREGLWQKSLKGLLEEGQFLEAYDLLYGLQEEHPAEPWPRLKLVALHDQIFFYGPAAKELSFQDKSYRDGVLGFSHFFRREWSAAKASWEEALLRGPAELPARPRIQRYLERVESELIALAPPPAVVEPLAPAAVVRPPRQPGPQEIESWYDSAFELHQKGQNVPALALLDKLLHHNARHEPAAKLRSRIREELAEQNQLKAEEYYLDGLMHYGQGRTDEALREFKKALELDPKNQRVLAALERTDTELKEMLR